MTRKTDILRYYKFWFNMEMLYEEWAKKQGLTSKSLFVLYTIHDNPQICTQHLISETLLLPKQTVNSILAGFESAGYVTKAPSAFDRRSKIIQFTSQGAQYADKILSKLHEFEENALYNMSAEERSNMLDNCEKFLSLLQHEFSGKEKP